ncbi:hypothetical protein [Lagierella sp.]|uniref:hypothetical protein n=1 Tax=Lagierella sp. TaxID=2849657 RepID=UPI0026118492|nr:hypothetical protein [Lagierella sp.]
MIKLLKILAISSLLILVVGCDNGKTKISDEEAKTFGHDFVSKYILGDGGYDYKELYDKYLIEDNEMFNKEMYIRQKSSEIYSKLNLSDLVQDPKVFDEKISKGSNEFIYDASVKLYKNLDEINKIRLVFKETDEGIKVINYYGFDQLSNFLGKATMVKEYNKGPEYYSDSTSATGEELKKLQRKNLLDLLGDETRQEVQEFPEYLERD